MTRLGVGRIMKDFKSYSQAGQDRFAYELIGGNGTFLDIGANHPVEKSNTYGLEQVGWYGLLVEQDDYCAQLCREQRKSPLIHTDATTANWKMLLKPLAKFGYISLDVDIATEPTLRGLLEHGIQFDVLTVEHDKYRFGPEPQKAMRKILTDAGYILICSDVCDLGMPFEDWWVSKNLEKKAARFRSDNQDWREIFQ